MIKNPYSSSIPEYKKGLNTSKGLLTLQPDETPACMNIEYGDNFVLSKRYGYSSMNTVSIGSNGAYGLYDYSYTVKVESGTVLLMHFDQNLTDDSPSKHVFSDYGSLDYSASTFGYQAHIDFGEYVYTGDSPDWYFAGSDFLIDWLYNPIMLAGEFSAECCSLIGQMTCRSAIYAGTMNGSWVIMLSGMVAKANSTAIIFLYNSGGEIKDRNTYPCKFAWEISYSGIYQGGLKKFAIQRSSNVMNLFIDGKKHATSFSCANTSFLDSDYSLYIGMVKGDLYDTDAYFDELRIVKRALYATDYDIPTAPYPSEGGLFQKLVVASGTGIYYSKDIGKTFVSCQTNRSVKNRFGLINQNIVAVDDNYDIPLYWSGTDETYFAAISTAAPQCKFVLSHQGYCIMLNENNNKTSMYYIDQNEMFTEQWDNFSFPTARNDEITAGFVLNKNLYVSTKYKLFKVLYVGGNPDWSYYEVKNFGFVPDTVQKISIPDIGEVVIGLDYTKRIRLFDGSNDKIISDKIYEDNGMTEFCLSQINDPYIGISWSLHDTVKQVYKLYVAQSPSTIPNICVSYNYAIGAFYLSNNQYFHDGIVATDTNNVLYPLALSNSGWIHCLDSGNTDNGTPVNDYYVSPFRFKDRPSTVQKLQEASLYFLASSSGTLHFEDRTNFSSVWNLRKSFDLVSGLSITMTSQSIDIPETVNVYQFKLSSSANTANPWTMLRVDDMFNIQGQGRR